MRLEKGLDWINRRIAVAEDNLEFAENLMRGYTTDSKMGEAAQRAALNVSNILEFLKYEQTEIEKKIEKANKIRIKIDGINKVLNELAYAEEGLENAQLAVDDSITRLFDVLPNDISRDWLKKYENDITKTRDGIQKVVLGLEKQKKELEGKDENGM